MEQSVRSDAATGPAFVEALGRKDFEAMGALLHSEVDFRALTPNRFWEASGSSAVVEEVLTQWFEDSDDIQEVLSTETGTVGDRQHVAYRLRVQNPDGEFVVEQQAYFTEQDGRIDWMRVLCSGFRPQ
jgi:hypothetical protein